MPPEFSQAVFLQKSRHTEIRVPAQCHWAKLLVISRNDNNAPLTIPCLSIIGAAELKISFLLLL
jgi:hypothetical protein